MGNLNIKTFPYTISLKTWDFRDTWDTCWDTFLGLTPDQSCERNPLLDKGLPLAATVVGTLGTLGTVKRNTKVKDERQ